MKLIQYNNLVMNEGGINLQKGMYFNIKGSYSIVLMSVEKNSPYRDEMLEDGIIKYEGHNQERVPKELKKFSTNQLQTNQEHSPKMVNSSKQQNSLKKEKENPQK